MSWNCIRTVEPSPFTLADIKSHLRVTTSTENDLITSYIKQATAWCEAFTHRTFKTTTWRLSLPNFESFADCSGLIRLPYPPLQSVSSITYVDESETTQTLSSSLYRVDTKGLCGSVRPAPNQSWPSVINNDPSAVNITFVAGYTGQIPHQALSGVNHMTTHYYENRQPIVLGTIATQIAFTVESELMQIMVPEVY